MTDYTNELRRLATTLQEAQREINLARQQSIDPEHLRNRSRRAAVQAAQVVVAAVDLGFTDIFPEGPWILSALRNPDDPDRPLLPFQYGDMKGQLQAIKLGSGCNPDGTLRDDTALKLWAQFICPKMRSMQTTWKAGAGTFDFPKVKTDDQGRVLGRDGKPLQARETIDQKTGMITEALDGPPARETNHYSNDDLLEHLRCQAADWVDACIVAEDLIRSESKLAAHRPDEKQTESAKPTGDRPPHRDSDESDRSNSVQATKDALSGRSLRFFNFLFGNSFKTYFEDLRERSPVFTKSDITDEGIKTGIQDLIKDLEAISAPYVVEWSMGDRWVRLDDKPDPNQG